MFIRIIHTITESKSTGIIGTLLTYQFPSSTDPRFHRLVRASEPEILVTVKKEQ